MNFQVIFEKFKNSSNGNDTFKQLKLQCELALKSPLNELESTALLIIYNFAKNYVLLYEDQEVTPIFAEKVKYQLTEYMSELAISLSSNDPHMILNALNTISQHYMASSRIF